MFSIGGVEFAQLRPPPQSFPVVSWKLQKDLFETLHDNSPTYCDYKKQKKLGNVFHNFKPKYRSIL